MGVLGRILKTESGAMMPGPWHAAGSAVYAGERLILMVPDERVARVAARLPELLAEAAEHADELDDLKSALEDAKADLEDVKTELRMAEEREAATRKAADALAGQLAALRATK